MKGIIRNTTINALGLYFLDLLISGVTVTGGLGIYLAAGLALSIMAVTIKPILSIISLPLNIVTLGFFSFLSNAIIIYLLTLIVPQVSVSAFTFPGISFAGFIVPLIYFNKLFALILCAAILSSINSFFEWLLS